MKDRYFDYEIQFGGFDRLMPYRVREILMVASPYDAFIMAEDDRLTELIFSEYLDLNLRYAPRVHRVSTRAEALKRLRKEKFDLIITMTRVGKIDIPAFARMAKKLRPGTPIIVLAFNMLDVHRVGEEAGGDVDRIFLWGGDARILMSIVKHVEDRRNIEHDIKTADVQSLLLIEDSVRFYSYYLPLIYTELMRQTQSLIAEGVNLSHKLLRMRARPKILLASTYEEAWRLYKRYRGNLLAVITDIRFPAEGGVDPEAGIKLITKMRRGTRYRDMPILLQSSERRLGERAAELKVAFLDKGSQDLHLGIRSFLMDHCGFGDFAFRKPGGAFVARVPDLHAMIDFLETVPEDSLAYHASRNHFSTWLMARTEFELAYSIRPRKLSEFESPADLRAYLIETLSRFLHKKEMGVVAEFSRRYFTRETPFVKMGGGSLGGKGRGLAFLSSLLSRHNPSSRWEGVRIRVPNATVLGTDVFDGFLEENGLQDFVRRSPDNEAIRKAFLRAELPGDVRANLQTFIRKIRLPLAVRSSSLMEDSAIRPFAGIYETYMLPNSHPDPEVRLDRLCRAVQLVYASTFLRRARTYLGSTAHLQHQEKMAVILQLLVGERLENRFYPDFAGVAQSYNYYPIGRIKATDGIAHVAMGLGESIVQGRRCLSFSPAHPENIYQFSSTKDFLDNSQREFMALDLSRRDFLPHGDPSANLLTLGLDAAEADGTLAPMGSTYSAENDRVSDGIYRPGTRLVTFANILKHGEFPLAGILRWLFEVGSQALSSPVEFEFAVNLKHGEFAILQMRPMISWSQARAVRLARSDLERAICHSPKALGHGCPTDVTDIVYVKPGSFDTAKTKRIASEIGDLNRRLAAEGRSYMLMGPGRWGSADPHLGIPVRWDDISSARLIVEATLPDFVVDASYGTHFLHNVISLEIGYFTVRHETGMGGIDWDWLDSQRAAEETGFLRYLRMDASLDIRIDGRRGLGAVLKPA